MTKRKTRRSKRSTTKRAPKVDRIVIVKRGCHTEKFDERKVYASAYYGCRNAHLSEKEAEKIAEKVCKAVSAFAHKEKVVLSDKLFQKIISELKKHNDDAAFLYATHRDIN